MRMSKCIYCPAEADSVEHHLPRALGNFKGYVPLLDRVCSACNGKLSLLDEQLCRSGMEAFFRVFLELKGRREHEKVSPFYRGGAGGGALEMLGTNQQTGDNVMLELVGGTEARELRCAQLVDDNDEVHVIRITDGMTPEQFRARFDALGIQRFKRGNLFAAEEEIPWIETLMATIKFENRTEWTRPTSGPITYGPSVVKFTLTSRYFRCLAKIGFHYFLTKVKHFRGDETCFRDIRDFIMNPSNIAECRRFISYTQDQLAAPLNAGARLRNWGHILCAETDYMNLRSKVELFAGPDVKQLVYTIQVGMNPSRIDYNEAYGDFYAYYRKEERGEFDGEVSELIGTRRLM